MKRLSPIFALLSLLLSLPSWAACTSSGTHLIISWTSNGNPGVPVRGSILKNCWTGYTVLDMTTEQMATLPTTVVSFTAPTMNDTYEIRVNGYDLNGDPISSKYEVVPVN